MVEEISIGLQDLWQLGESDWPKPVDSEDILEDIEVYPISRNRRVSVDLGISLFNMVGHLHQFGQSIWSCRIVPHIIKILQTF